MCVNTCECAWMSGNICKCVWMRVSVCVCVCVCVCECVCRSTRMVSGTGGSCYARVKDIRQASYRHPAARRSSLRTGIANNFLPKLELVRFFTVSSPYPYRFTQAVWFALLHLHSRKGNLRKMRKKRPPRRYMSIALYRVFPN